VRTLRLAASFAVAMAVGASAASAPAASEPAWTLQSLGQPALQLPVHEHVGEQTVPFDVPSTAPSAQKRWYLGRLHFEIKFDRSSGPGLVYVSLLTNDRAAILVKFRTKRRHGRLRVLWNTVDLLHGRRDHTTASPRIMEKVSNFLQDRGLRPGPNTLAFRIERYGRARVRAATVLEDSGVLSTIRGPAHLTLEVPVRDRRIAVGDQFSLPYVVRSTGDRSPERVSVAVQYDQRALTALGATTRRLDPHASTWHGRFRLRAKRAGTTHVLLGVKSTANRPGADIAVRVDRGVAGVSASRWWKGLGGLGLLLLAAAAIIGLVSRARPSDTSNSPA
jgi:hypothetical protein